MEEKEKMMSSNFKHNLKWNFNYIMFQFKYYNKNKRNTNLCGVSLIFCLDLGDRAKTSSVEHELL